MQKVNSIIIYYILNSAVVLTTALLIKYFTASGNKDLFQAAFLGLIMMPVFRQDFKSKKAYLAAVLVSGCLVTALGYMLIRVTGGI